MRLKIYVLMLFFIFKSGLEANNLVEIVLPNNQWKLIGVPGGFREGSETDKFSQSAGWKGYTGDVAEFIETVDNNLYTGIRADGTVDSAFDGTLSINSDIVSFSVIDHDGTTEPTAVTMNVYTTGHSYDATSPTRGMYVSADGSGDVADIHIKYQAHFEGANFEMKISYNTTIKYYTGTFNSSNSASSPQVMTEKTGTSGIEELTLPTILDMDFTNNPGKSGQDNSLEDYTSATNRDAMAVDDYLRVWRRDSVNSVWESYHSKNTNNHFTELVAGASYWVKLYDETEATTKHGLILGDGSISSSTHLTTNKPLSSASNTSYNSVAHSLITDGWNMLSFNDGDIRDASTGLILTIATATIGHTYIIKDDSGKESVTVTLYDIDGSGGVATVKEIAQATNLQVASAKASGTVSRNFNIRALTDGTNIILISNKRFRVYEGGNDVFGSVVTLGNQQPFDLNTNGYATTDLTTTGVASRYGEYTLLATINNDGGANTAGPLLNANHNVGKVQINTNTAISVAEEKVALVTTALDGDSDINKAISIDTDLDGNIDSTLLVNTSSPFYIRDHTFSRAYTVDTASLDPDPTVYIDNGIGTTTLKSLATGNTIADVKTDLDILSTDIEAVGVDEAGTTDDTLYLVTDNKTYRYFDLKDTGTSTDIFTPIYSSNALSKGAIVQVYSISDLAKAAISKNSYNVTISGAGANNKLLQAEIDGEDTTDIYDNGEEAGQLCVDLKSAINGFSADAYAECNTSTVTDTTATLYLSGYFSKASIKTDDVTLNGNNDANYEGTLDWGSATVGGDIVGNTTPLTYDLKYQPIWSPDFPTEAGAVHNLNSAGFDTVFMLSAVEDGSGSVAWNFLDLTKDVDEWFNPIDDYSLFSTEMERGYWVYLNSKDNNSSAITINGSSALLTTNFIHHYNNSSRDITNFLMSGTLSVPVSGFVGDKKSVVASINGLNFNMIESGDNYTLDLSSYELGYLPESNLTVTVSAFDSSGNLQTDTNISLDLEPPLQPLVQFIDGKHLFMGVRSAESTLNFNIYSGDIDEKDATPSNRDGSTYVTEVDSTNALSIIAGNLDGSTIKTVGDASTTLESDGQSTIDGTTYTYKLYNICQDATSFDTANTGWRVVAVDGESADTSRVSDFAYISDTSGFSSQNTASATFYPIYKNASILYSTGSGVVDNTPRNYDSSCNYSSVGTSDNGVTLEAYTATDIWIAYEPLTAVSIGTNIPKTAYIQLDGSTKLKVDFSGSYVTSLNAGLSSAKNIYIYNGTDIYITTFDAIYGTNEQYNTDGSPINITTKIGLTGQTISNSLL